MEEMIKFTGALVTTRQRNRQDNRETTIAIGVSEKRK
jgi:hypothetical protein